MTPSDNSIQAIHPYYHEGLWVFDDAAVDLVKEPFVGGADKIMDVISEQVQDGKNGFTLVFSSRPFPGHQITLEWLRPEYDGNTYRCRELGMDGWLCPALLKYFDEAPQEIYAEVRPRPQAA